MARFTPIRLFTLLPDVYENAAALAHYLYLSQFIMGTFLVFDKIIEMIMKLPSLLKNYIKFFLHQHGPSIVDVVLESPPIRTYRSTHTRISNAFIAKGGRTTLLSLPNELLVEIGDSILELSHQDTDELEQDLPMKDLLNFSMTNKRLRELASPIIFRTISLEQGWSRSRRALRAMERSTGSQTHTVNFMLNAWTGYTKTTQPPGEIPTLLASVLPRLQKLEKLHLIVPARHVREFEKAFLVGEVILPQVKTLVLGPSLEFVISYCPNVVSICTTNRGWPHSKFDDEAQYIEFMKAAGQARFLSHFQMNLPWERGHLLAVLVAMPNIEKLSMLGGRYKDNLDDLLPVLARFPGLRTLDISDEVYLDAPFVILSHFGRGDEYSISWAAQRRAAAEKILRQVSSLRKLIFSGHWTASVPASNRRDAESIEWTYGCSDSLTSI